MDTGPTQAPDGRRIAFIGVGLMGGLLMERLLRTGFTTSQILACEAREARRGEVAQQWEVEVTDDPRRAAAFGDAVLMATPPRAVLGVLREIAAHLRPSAVVISVAAAVPLAALERACGDGVPIVRLMPNSPSRVGEGMNPVAFGRFVTADTRAWVMRLLAHWGDTLEVPDALMNLCVGLAAAAPTYILSVIEALTEAGVAGGLPLNDARRLAAGVVCGSAALVTETGESPEALKALTPLQPLREAEAKALFRDAVEVARAQMDALQARLVAAEPRTQGRST
jgi:pyrroline-5-carboxylate reductase